MAEISDVEFLDGNREVEQPTLIISARTARLALDTDELVDLVEKALNALEMTGKRIVYIDAEPA